TFGGYRQLPMRTPPELKAILGDPLADCDSNDPLAAALGGDVLECSFTIVANTELGVELGLAPKEIEVAIQSDPTNLDQLVKPMVQPPPAPPPPTIDAEKLEK